MNYESLLQLLNGFHAGRALVLGDVMLDRFVYGSIERISPEAPIPVLAIDRTSDMPGGAGNVVRNLAAMGGQATLIGVVGNDAWADSLGAQLKQVPQVRSRLVVDGSRPTTVKTRYVAEGQQVLRADRESRGPLSEDSAMRVLEEYDSALSEVDIVILSDYGKGVLSESVVGTAISKARAAGRPVIVDPKSKTFEKYRGATVLTPNRHELQAACGFECATDEEIVLGARQTLDGGICQTMVVTRGKDGMSVVQSDGSALHLRTTAREVFDVSGAGDTVAAAMSLGLAAGGNIGEACTLANVAAGIVVGKPGTAIVTTSEIMAALRPFDGRTDRRKLFSLETVVRLAQDWRQQGLKIAFANGCFDLLHPGHISLIDQARRSADRLIVGLNSDSSIRRLKGAGRPVQGEVARATVLASLKSVDAVVIFSEDTPLRLIDTLLPDVLVKGADYSVDKVVGGDLVIQRGVGRGHPGRTGSRAQHHRYPQASVDDRARMSDPGSTAKVVILDRDGTIVVDRHYLSDPDELELLPGAAEGLRRWSERGFRLVVITNQSGIGRGLFSVARLHQVHARLRDMVGAVGARIERIYYCPHTPEADCTCRKPRPELLMRAASELGFDPSKAIVVGDKSTDVELGRRVGATTILITSDMRASEDEPAHDYAAADLAQAARLTEHL